MREIADESVYVYAVMVSKIDGIVNVSVKTTIENTL